MIKVLKLGKPKRTTCKGCHSRLEYDETDKKSRFICNHSCDYIKCPICGREIYTIK